MHPASFRAGQSIIAGMSWTICPLAKWSGSSHADSPASDFSIVIEGGDIGYLENVIQCVQLRPMQAGEAAQFRLAIRRHADPYQAPVVGVVGTANQASFFAPLHQCQGTMRQYLQPLCELAHGSGVASGQSLQVKQQQVLLRRQVFPFNGQFTETQEAAKLIAKFRQCFKVGLGQFS